MKIRLLTGWNGNVKGAELDLDAGQADLLIQRAKAVSIEPDAYPAVLQKAEKPVADKAIHKAPKNKRRT